MLVTFCIIYEGGEYFVELINLTVIVRKISKYELL